MFSSTKLQQAKPTAISVSESQRSDDFEGLLLEAIDAALSQLGDTSKRAIYSYLKKNFTIEKQDIPNRIKEFNDAIERVFGQGAKIIEIEIMKNLFAEIGSAFKYFPEKDDLLFVEFVYAARTHVSKCCH